MIIRSTKAWSRLLTKKRIKSMACQYVSINPKSHMWCTLEVNFNGHFYWCECECHEK